MLKTFSIYSFSVRKLRMICRESNQHYFDSFAERVNISLVPMEELILKESPLWDGLGIGKTH